MVGFLLVVILLVLIVAATLVVPGWARSAGISSFVTRFTYLANRAWPVVSRWLKINRNTQYTLLPTSNHKPDMNALNCRASPTSMLQEGSFVDVFCVEICGLIRSAEQGQSIKVRISIQDVTEGPGRTKPVNAKVKQYQVPGSDEFSYTADLGRIPGRQAVLNDWTTVAQLRIDRLIFAHRGKRQLKFFTKVLNSSGSNEIAAAVCDCIYDNPEFGYVDLQENLRQTKTLTVALAFSVGSAVDRLNDPQVEMIKKWAREHLDISETIEGGVDKLNAALDETVAFFNSGHQLDIEGICHKLTEIASPAGRYDALELVMQVIAAKKNVTANQMNMFAELAEVLELDSQRVRAMCDKFIPLHHREDRDAGVVLGVSSDMNRQTAREYLNKEYAKWNARVTSCDPNVQTQADQMLRLIAEARNTYVEKACNV
jgi:hypothetical protein